MENIRAASFSRAKIGNRILKAACFALVTFIISRCPVNEGSFPAANVLPTTVSAQLNARLLPGDQPEKVLSDLQELLSDLPLEVELVHAGEESFITSDKQPMFRLLQDVLQEKFPHLPCIPTLMPSDSDARHYCGLSDCVLRFAPIVTGEEGGGNTHMGDEFLAEDSLGVAVEIYRSLMKKL